MSLTLGEKLQQAREERGISISEVAEHTRISPLYLTAIENNDYRTLPGGIFNKGFLKSYAKYVGIDEQEALQDYSTLISQQTAVSEEPQTYRPEVLTDDYSNSSSFSTYIFAAIILGLLIVGILAALKYLKNNGAETANSANTNTNSAVSLANTNTANANAAAQNIPSTNEIKLELKALNEAVSVEATIDGKKASKEVAANVAEIYSAQQTLRIRYSRYKQVQLTLNGKPIQSPPAPAKGNGIEFEINKSNIAQILQSGEITSGNTTATVQTPAPR